MVELLEKMKEIAKLGWGVTARVLMMCLAVAAVAVAFGFAGLPGFM
jgi:hypothetical protein